MRGLARAALAGLRRKAGGPSVCGWKRAQAGLVRPGPAAWAGLGRKEVGRGFGLLGWFSFSNFNSISYFYFFFLSSQLKTI